MIAWVLSAALALGEIAPPRPLGEPLDPPREARVMLLGKELRCAVCQGLSIADSPSSMARAQLEKVRELVVQGKSDDEIYAYFVDRYGEWALLRPKAAGLNWMLWAGPLVLLGLGFWLIWSMKRPLDPATPAASPPVSDPSAPEDPYLARIRKDLESP